MDCKACNESEAISAFEFNGNIMGIMVCWDHSIEFFEMHPELSQAFKKDRIEVDFDKACVECMSQISVTNGVYPYRMKFSNGWMNPCFVGCRKHINALFRHFESKERDG